MSVTERVYAKAAAMLWLVLIFTIPLETADACWMAKDIPLEKQAALADSWGIIHVTDLHYSMPGSPVRTFIEFEWIDVDGVPFGSGGTLFYQGGMAGEYFMATSTSPRMEVGKFYIVLLANSSVICDQDEPMFELPLGAMSVLEVVPIGKSITSDAIVLANKHHKLKVKTTEGAVTWSTLIDVVNEIGEYQFKTEQSGGNQ